MKEMAIRESTTWSADLFQQMLGDNSAALPLRAERVIRETVGASRVVVACEPLDLQRYASLGCCELACAETPRPDRTRIWGGEKHDTLTDSVEQAVWQIAWRGTQLEVVELHWTTSCGNESRHWVVADSLSHADEFILDVERRTHHPGQAILVFADGYWRRSEALYRAVHETRLDDLVLADDLAEQIRRDFTQFLDSEQRYLELGISWRRGALLVGPPGNGKTHFVRGLINSLQIPCLYVRSAASRYQSDEQVWSSIFRRARGLVPCVLVLEDLDSMITAENRSIFLNQLDGFERNHGLIVLATTNYPERIDAGIVNRPSRFDRKYHFPPPELAERIAFLNGWRDRLADEIAWSAADVEQIATQATGFSYAALKELVVSALMAWMADPQLPFAETIAEQCRLLRQQMRSEPGTQNAPPAQSGNSSV